MGMKWHKELTEEALLEEIKQAKINKQLADTIEPRAASVNYIAVPPIMKYSKWAKSETWFLCIYIIHWFHRIVIQKPGFFANHNEWNRYNSVSNLIIITLKNGVIFSIPPRLIQGLENATETQLNDVWLSESGSSIHWDSLDADFSIPGLIAGVFGTEKWMNKLTVLGFSPNSG